MKKSIFLVILSVVFTSVVSAQGFYFDVGFGGGKAWTKHGEYDVVKELRLHGENFNELAMNLGLKAGGGPFRSIPIYIVGEFSIANHMLLPSSGHMTFSTFMIGPGVIFYPIPLIQLGASVGYSYTMNMYNTNDLQWGGFRFHDATGFGWNVSLAADLGSGNNGVLIGVKYFHTSSTTMHTFVDQSSSMLGLFVRYAYRKKTARLF